MKFKDSPKLRGLTIYTVDADEARGHAMQAPAVKAGWFEVVVDAWLMPCIPVTLGNRVDIEV